MTTTDEERLSAIRAVLREWPSLESITLPRAALEDAVRVVDRLKAERKDYEEKWYSSNRSLRAAWEECDLLRARVARLEAVETAARALDTECHGWADEDRVSAPKRLFKALREALDADTPSNDGGDRGA